MNLKQQAYSLLKEKILRCEYPPFTILNEEKLVKELGASKTPVRDALGRLEQESLVQILPKKGIRVTGITPDEVKYLYDMRLLLESFGLKHYGCTIEKNVFNALAAYCRRNVKDIPVEELNKWDDDFHHLFINASGNTFLIRSYNVLFDQIIRLRTLCGKSRQDRSRLTLKEHGAIVRCCMKKDWDGAIEALRYHLNKSKDVSFSIIENLSRIFPVQNFQ